MGFEDRVTEEHEGDNNIGLDRKETYFLMT